MHEDPGRTDEAKHAYPEPLREAETRLLGARAAGPRLGVAVSGGGIRSATFALGVFQAWARRGLLRRIHFLSTVSGGGYFGSSLTTTMIKSNGKFVFGGDSGNAPNACLDAAPTAVHHCCGACSWRRPGPVGRELSRTAAPNPRTRPSPSAIVTRTLCVPRSIPTAG